MDRANARQDLRRHFGLVMANPGASSRIMIDHQDTLHHGPGMEIVFSRIALLVVAFALSGFLSSRERV
jgi:hypothetical protein